MQRQKTRKVLKRAQADSISLYVQRDTSSISSKWTDNLSKISRVFDSNVFSTKVYERVFRGSVKDALKQQQVLAGAKARLQARNIYLLGHDDVGKDDILNTIIKAAPPTNAREREGIAHGIQMQKLCVGLMCIILKRGTPDWDNAQTSILLA